MLMVRERAGAVHSTLKVGRKVVTMTHLKFYLFCIMIAAPQGALGSADEEFVEKWLTTNALYSSIIDFRVIRNVDFDDCVPEAINAGAQAIVHRSGCTLAFLSDPLCALEKGPEHLLIRKDFLTDGSPSDNASYDVTYFQRYAPAGRTVRAFRVESPTILEFGDVVDESAPYEKKFQYFSIVVDGDFLAYSKGPAFVDPSCYSTSSCSEVFVTTAPEIPESEILILYDICGQSIQVDSGKSFTVLSHEGLGCKNFPNDYPVSDCWAEFTGAGEITLNVTLVNFRESDQCDGFTMTAVTDDASGSSTSTDLCDDTAPTELTSAGGKVRIEFGGSASPTREKYGFDIQVTAA